MEYLESSTQKKMETNKDINSSEAKQIVKETFIESGVSAFSLIDLIESQNKNDLLNMMEESTVNGGNVAGSILGLFDLIKQVVETKDAYAETNKVETSKKVLSIVEIWDPTGITTIANALLQPGCNDDPIYTEEINKVNKSKRRK